MKNFTPDPVESFEIYDITFNPLGDISVDAMAYASSLDSLKNDDPKGSMALFLGFLDLVLDEPSGTALRMMVENRKIGLRTIFKIVQHIMEGYGMRPTVQSLNSVVSLPGDDGTNSMAGAQADLSTQGESVSHDD
jgi:hypothetical protein